jgi:hypothetical protein
MVSGNHASRAESKIFGRREGALRRGRQSSFLARQSTVERVSSVRVERPRHTLRSPLPDANPVSKALYRAARAM